MLSALIQNFDTVEEAIETSSNSAGSALKENERYLDSIQGKIDQFNNAMQSMWSNTLDSDWVKGFVSLGTEIIKIIDNIGLLRTALFGLFTYLSNKKDGSFDLASMLGIHDKEKGWTFGQEGLTGKIKEKIQQYSKKKSVTKDVLGDPADIKMDVQDYAKAISDNIDDYVKVDTSKIDTQIENIQNKLMIAREQLDDAKSKDWNYYKSLGSAAPAADRDNRVAEKQKEVSSLEQQLTELQTKRSETMSNAALQYAESSINNIKAEAQAQRSLFEALDKVKGIKLSIGNEDEATKKIDQINQAAAQGQVALKQYSATLGDNDLALQAYIASLNGEKASLGGFNQFIQQHNAGVKASGVAAKVAAVGHAALNAALSMGLSVLIQFAIDGFMKLAEWINNCANPTQKLEDELSDLSQEVKDTQSEIDSLNDELKTTQERMAELLALPTLSFTDQEELNNLKLQNDELERNLKLQETLLESQKKEQVAGAKNLINSAWRDQGDWYVEDGVIYDDSGWNGFWHNSEKTTDILDSAFNHAEILSAELKAMESGGAYGLGYLLDTQHLEKVTGSISQVLSKHYDYIKEHELSYGMDTEIDKYLDEVYAYGLKLRQLESGNVKSEAISGLFDQTSTKELQTLGKELKVIADNDTLTQEDKNKQIEQRIKNIDLTADAYHRLQVAMQTVGVTAEDIANYLVLETGAFDSSTVEGVTTQYLTALDAMRQVQKYEEELGKKFATAEKLHAQGWKSGTKSLPETSFSTVVANDENTRAIVISPVLPNGAVLTPDALNQYAQKILSGVEIDQELTFTMVEGEDATAQAIEILKQNKIEELARLEKIAGDLWGAELFTLNEDGKFEANVIEFGELLKGMDEDARKTFFSLAEQAKNGAITWDQALEIFKYKGDLAALEIITEQVTALNNVYFGDVADQFNGLIDTVGELKSALDSVVSSMELVKNAQEQMNHSGRVSVKTALELMESTENWDKILNITEGTITLNADAEDVLVNEKLDHIKANYQTALSEVQTQIATIKAQGANVELSRTLDQSTNESVRTLAASMAYLNEIMLANAKIAAGDTVNMDKVITEAQNKYNDVYDSLYSKESEPVTSTQTLSDLEAEEKKLQTQIKLLEQVDDMEGLGNYYDYDKTPGDKYSDGAIDKLQSKYERQIKNLENQQTYLENEIAILEAKDEPVSRSYYDKQIDIEEEKLGLYKLEREELLKLNRTDEVAERLWEVEHAIQESTLRMVEFRQSIIDLYKTAFDDIVDAYGNKEDLLSDRQSYIDKYRELMELQGGVPTASMYESQIETETMKQSDNLRKLHDLRAALQTAMRNGLEEGSEEWIDMQAEIRATEAAILDNKIAIEQYKEELKQLSVEAFNLMRNAFSNKDNFLTNQQDYVQGYIDLLEAQSIDVPAELYDKLIAIEKDKRANLVEDLTNEQYGARKMLADIEAKGFTAADEEWQDAYGKVAELEKAIQDCDIATAQWEKAIRDLDFEKFERFTNRLDDIASEIDHVRNLLSDDDVASEDGSWTEEGITSLGLLYQQMQLSEQQSQKYAKKIQDLTDAYKRGEMSEQEYYERLQELKEGQWDAIEAYEDSRDAIVDMEEARIDMIEEGINKEIEAYQELIDLKKEELDAERD